MQNDDRPPCEPGCRCQCRQTMCGCHDFRQMAPPQVQAPAPSRRTLRLPFLKKKDTP